MTPQPPEMKTFVIWDYELEELTYGNRLDTKKQLNKDVRSRPSPSPSELAATAYQAGIECGREEGAAPAREKVLTEIVEHLQSKRGEVMRMATDAYPIGVLDGTVLYLESLRRAGGDE